MKALVKNSGTVEVRTVEKAPVRSTSDVLIRVAVAGLCRTGVYVAGDKIKSRKTPLILGHEFSGIVEGRGAVTQHIFGGRDYGFGG